AAESGYAYAGGHRERLIVYGEFLLFDLFADAFEGDHAVVSLDVSDDFQKFFSALASAYVGLAGGGFLNFCEGFVYRVASLVFEGTVYFFEVVEVADRDQNGKVMSRCCTKLPADPYIYGTAIGQAGQWVGQRHFFQLAIFRLYLTMKLYYTQSYVYSCAEFALVEWLG